MESKESKNQQNRPDDYLDENKQRISGIWENITTFLHDLLDIREDSDRDETIEAVRKDISFQGHNAWILIFSIFVASIGLNTNSTAVVIGAMLISPLMGPIVGMGLGTAINDDRMLRRSLINLGVMVGLSLLTASLYFSISPIIEITDELLARTYPTILDVFIAIFGGLALIIAKAKKGTISNAIAGVAIATALMPPLCTAGYGIATGQWSYFGGAMYLFCINTVFIALSTFVVCKLLKFPMVRYANQAKRKRVSRWATAIGVLVLLPSVFFFWQLYTVQIKNIAVNKFMQDYVQYDGMRPSKEWNKETNTLDVVMFGAPVPQDILDDWKSKFNQIEPLKNSEVRFYQGNSIPSTSNEGVEIVQEELIDKLRMIQDKDAHIKALEDELRYVANSYKDFNRLSEEVRLNYPQIASLSFAESFNKDFTTQKTDTIAVYNISFKDAAMTAENRTETKNRLADWLRYRLQSDKIRINEVAKSL